MLEAAIMVRIDDMDKLSTVGALTIRLTLTEIGPETLHELVAEALREAPDPEHHGEKWTAS